ncbi:Transmembrane BAX inhibitor motif-containing protein 4 [Intoshia linei]|uniref:Transmembrane BAX inhibitor motif-containing protein 4 n=1 Tax=Intoshia linei TaxID=1819745 RepID=A0A177APX2_9BILA|nr:Transmembrane BAX inhibitor motif-containing protein 4 [Intoshia linei]
MNIAAPPDYNEPKNDMFEFNDMDIRKGFIKKTYMILTAQLLFTIAIISIFIFVKPIKIFVLSNIWLLYVSLILTIVFILILGCCSDLRRKFPINVILLGVFTFFESIILGTISSFYDTNIVLIAMGVTAALVVALTIFAIQTKVTYDFTTWGSALIIITIGLLIFGLFSIIFQNEVLNLLYSVSGAVLFSFWLIYDTQMMLGGKHKYSLSPEEYIFAALSLYVDIVQLFMFIMSLMGRS